MDKKSILVVLGGGGHSKQLLNLTDNLADSFNYEYIIGSDDKISEKNIKFGGPIFRIINPRKMTHRGLLKIILRFIPSTLQAIYVLFKSKADAVLIVGPAICLHVAVLAKYIFNKKIIFLESWSRVYNKSWSGKALYGMSDLFFVQWSQQLKNYPKALYLGRLG